MLRGVLFFLAGCLVLTACGGGGSGSGSDEGAPSSSDDVGVKLTFTPMNGGFQISNQSDFGDLVSLRIIAISESGIEEGNIDIAEFIDGIYNLLGLDDQSNWIFRIIGILSDGSEQEVAITFVWEENRIDHNNGGIQTGANMDGDGRADAMDDDMDGDGVENGGGNGNKGRDLCPAGATGWQSNASTDNDGDGCRDADEDTDDDNDGIGDNPDLCPAGATGWQSNASTDNDGDGCRDADEDTDDDNDGLDDGDTREQQSNLGGKSCSLLADCDGDGIRDIDEVAANCILKIDCDDDGVRDIDEAIGCVLDADCDDDGVRDADEAIGCVLDADCDDDGVRDADEMIGCVLEADCDGDSVMDGEDVDDDGDGLVEVASAADLNSVRYALNGEGSRLAENAELKTDGCGNGAAITSCAGYELVADISLATYSDGEGWQPLGHDTNSRSNGCDGNAFNGTFDGNGFMISELSINRLGEDCVGLFGHTAAGSTIRNLTLHIDSVIGRSRVGGMVGNGEAVRIHSSFVVAAEVSGSSHKIGGMVGYAPSAQVVSSSVVATEVRGDGNNVGGMVGFGRSAQVVSSSVVAAEVRGGESVGGMVGYGPSVLVVSSFVVAREVSGSNYGVGGLVGWGNLARIVSSSVVAGEVRGSSHSVGGLVGWALSARIASSSVVTGDVGGTDYVGGMAGYFSSGRLAYSYMISGGANATMLVGRPYRAAEIASYWDSETSGIEDGNLGVAKTSDELQTPMDYEGIYDTWDNHTNIFGNGEDEPLAVWCDEDNSGSIESDEQTPDNLIWDFGESDEYPAIRCTPLGPDEWRDWWFLNETGQPELNQDRLDQLLP